MSRYFPATLVYSESVPRKLDQDYPKQGPNIGLAGVFRQHERVAVNKFSAIILCCALTGPPSAAAYSLYGEENPFVEAMLRMMEIFGLIQRDRLPLSVPYLPGYGGLPGISGPGGLSPLPATGAWGGIPGLTTPPGTGLVPGTGLWTGAGAPGFGGPPGGWVGQGYPGWGTGLRAHSRLDGIWELDKGSVALIRGNTARLYVSRGHYQDFSIHYDAHYLWWQPRQGGRPSRYRYQTRDGRMILQDEEGNLLLMRRRR